MHLLWISTKLVWKAPCLQWPVHVLFAGVRTAHLAPAEERQRGHSPALRPGPRCFSTAGGAKFIKPQNKTNKQDNKRKQHLDLALFPFSF